MVIGISLIKGIYSVYMFYFNIKRKLNMVINNDCTNKLCLFNIK